MKMTTKMSRAGWIRYRLGTGWLVPVLLAAAVSTALAAAAYTCKVLVKKDCVQLGAQCNVEGQGGNGTIVDADLTFQCSDGSPGWSDCGQKGTNTVACNYLCRTPDGNSYVDWPQQTRTPEFELKGTNCGTVLPPPAR